jgi:hypothetical protein
MFQISLRKFECKIRYELLNVTILFIDHFKTIPNRSAAYNLHQMFLRHLRHCKNT